MLKHAHKSANSSFLIATEIGLLHRLKKEMPTKRFVAADDEASCRFMKMINLENLRDCLRDGRPEVIVPLEIAARARGAVDRMLAVKP